MKPMPPPPPPKNSTQHRRRAQNKRKEEQQLEQMYKKRMVANLRERQRTEISNTAYNQLYQKIPKIAKISNEKESKYNILRVAMDYIEFLDQAIKGKVVVNSRLEVAFAGWRLEKQLKQQEEEEKKFEEKQRNVQQILQELVNLDNNAPA